MENYGTVKIRKIKNLIQRDQRNLILIALLYQIGILSIGILNYPYIDDTARQLTGKTDFAWSYSRWGSEVASWLVQGSRHLTDMGLTTHILTGLILTLASILVVYVLNSYQLSLRSSLASLLIGLNPWFLQCVSFRFDSPYMALSILFSVLPFLWWTGNLRSYFLASLISIFLMCNTYQLSSGLYIVMVLALSLQALLKQSAWKQVVKKMFLSMLSYVAGMGLYKIETHFNSELAKRGGTVAVASLKEMPATIIKNIDGYYRTIIGQSAKIWLMTGFLVLLFFVVTMICTSQINKFKATGLVFLYLGLASILSYGMLLLFSQTLAEWTPRYAYGFGFFMAVTVILIPKNEKKWSKTYLIGNVCAGLFFYYMLSFPLIYASNLSAQQEAFQRQSMQLATDLKEIVTPERQLVKMNAFFKESPIVENSARNYPILKKLIPNNADLYWPNVLLFNTYTQLNVSIQSINDEEFKNTTKTLEVSNVYWDIYTSEDQIFVIRK